MDARMDAALCFTAKDGWHLVPSRALRIHFHRAKPRWRTDPDRTAALMLDQGYSDEHVTRTIQKITRVVEDSDGTPVHPRNRLLREAAELAQAGEGRPGGLAGHLD